MISCTVKYHDERSNPDTGHIYKIKTEHADLVVKDALVKSVKMGELDSFESTSGGYLFKIKKIESKVVLIPVSDNEGAYLGVALDISGSGGYLSTKMPPEEIFRTIELVEKIRVDLEQASSGVIRRDEVQVIEGVYP